MNPTITLATARRIITQLRHDHRTVAMMILVPTLVMILPLDPSSPPTG